MKSARLREMAADRGGSVLYCGDTEYDAMEAKVAGSITGGIGGGYRPGIALERADPLVVIDDFAEIAAALEDSVHRE